MTMLLRKHQSVIGLEALHKAEKVLEDLLEMSVHYNQMGVEHRREAVKHIETLCIYAEELVEDLKESVDVSHLRQIEKFTYKHTK